jgi:transposase InsO family protein
MKHKVLKLVNRAIRSGAHLNKCCEILGVAEKTIQRWRNGPQEDRRKSNRVNRNNALSKSEIDEIIRVCCSAEYRDMNPNEIVAALAEKGIYIASERSMYRVLNKRNLLTHRSESKPPERSKPEELVATGPNQVWSWDITYLLRTVRGTFFYLYLIVDIWDRFIVGWSIHEKQYGYYAKELLNRTLIKYGIKKDQLTLHQDNGGPMISEDFLSLLEGRHVKPSYSRAGVCDDNPYSESLFKTLKYRPAYPKVFDNLEHANKYVEKFVEWYNNEHRHSKISFVTPSQRRNGEDINILKTRQKTYEMAYHRHPERWSKNIRNWSYIETVTLNPKKSKKIKEDGGYRKTA